MLFGDLRTEGIEVDVFFRSAIVLGIVVVGFDECFADVGAGAEVSFGFGGEFGDLFCWELFFLRGCGCSGRHCALRDHRM